MTGFAEAVTGASNHLAHQALEAGHPGLPLLAILCLSVTCAIGLPGVRPGDDRVSASILWWRLRIAAFAGALYLSSFDAPPELPPPREKFLGIF